MHSENVKPAFAHLKLPTCLTSQASSGILALARNMGTSTGVNAVVACWTSVGIGLAALLLCDSLPLDTLGAVLV